MNQVQRGLNGKGVYVVESNRFTPSQKSFFVASSQVMNAADISRALTRIAHEILERNRGLQDVVLIGLQSGGTPLAKQLQEILYQITKQRIPLGILDIGFYRDDIALRPLQSQAFTDISFDLSDKKVILVDDVLFTGRTVRAALNALVDYGRPQSVQLGVMIDRGHRELPIRPDFVGKNLPTRQDEVVEVSLDGVSLGQVVNP